MSRIALFLTLIVVLLAACTPSPAVENTPTLPVVQATDTTAPLPQPTQPPVEPTVTEAPTEAPTAEPTAAPAGWVAYVDRAGNLHLLDRSSGEDRQLTTDGTPQPFATPGEGTVYYTRLEWSPDGNQLAFMREVGTPVESGFDMSYTLMVYNLAGGEMREVMDGENVSQFAWRPGTEQIAFSQMIDPNYFINQDPALAPAMMVVDITTGEVSELVSPENGKPLIGPRWSPDGRFLAFDEVIYNEGRGNFAYFDFEQNEYLTWGEVIGNYDWSPDGEWLVYDRLAYTPIQSERIWRADRSGENEVLLSSDEDAYAFGPKVSPDGSQVAYWIGSSEIDSQTYTLAVVPADGSGEPRTFGQYEQVFSLNWTPDGSAVLFTAGPMETRSVYEVSVADGAERVLVEGMYGVAQPAQ